MTPRSHAIVGVQSDETPALLCDLVHELADSVLAGLDRASSPLGERAAGHMAVGHGACGLAHALTQIGREVPAQVREPMRRASIDTAACPPGLMDGLAGMAWTFWELGLGDEACRLISQAFHHPRLFDVAGIHRGSSGVGLAALWMSARVKDRRYLAKAREIGEQLSRTACEDASGVCWPAPDRHIHLGYAEGASGVAAFLLYLYLSTGEWRWLKLGRAALEFDVSRLPDASSDRAGIAVESATIPACGASGTAGVAGVLGRYYAVLGHWPYERALRTVIERLLPPACNGRLGYFDGLAGVGQCLLDLAVLCRSAEAERGAMCLARTIASRAIAWPAGSASFATGAAGIALFLHRVRTRQTSSFMLDELFDRRRLQRLVVYQPSDAAPRAAAARRS